MAIRRPCRSRTSTLISGSGSPNSTRSSRSSVSAGESVRARTAPSAGTSRRNPRRAPRRPTAAASTSIAAIGRDLRTSASPSTTRSRCPSSAASWHHASTAGTTCSPRMSSGRMSPCRTLWPRTPDALGIPCGSNAATSRRPSSRSRMGGRGAPPPCDARRPRSCASGRCRRGSAAPGRGSPMRRRARHGTAGRGRGRASARRRALLLARRRARTGRCRARAGRGFVRSQRMFSRGPTRWRGTGTRGLPPSCSSPVEDDCGRPLGQARLAR